MWVGFCENTQSRNVKGFQFRLQAETEKKKAQSKKNAFCHFKYSAETQESHIQILPESNLSFVLC